MRVLIPDIIIMNSELQNPDFVMPEIKDTLPVLKFVFGSLFDIWQKDPFTGKSLIESYHEFIEMSERLKLVKICIRSVLSEEPIIAEKLSFRADATNYKIIQYYNNFRMELTGVTDHMPLNNTLDSVRTKVNAHEFIRKHVKMNLDDIAKYFDLKREISDLWVLDELAYIETNGKSIIDTSKEIDVADLIVITQDHYDEYHERFMTFWLSKIFIDDNQMNIAFQEGEQIETLRKFATIAGSNMQTTYTEKGIIMRCVLHQLYRFLHDKKRIEGSGN
jgi:hypothetical protein